MMADTCTCVYTNQVHKKAKNRKWWDGKLKIESKLAVLYDEEGKELARAALPDTVDWDGEVAIGKSILVTVDEPPRSSIASANPAAPPPSSSAQPKQQPFASRPLNTAPPSKWTKSTATADPPPPVLKPIAPATHLPFKRPATLQLAVPLPQKRSDDDILAMLSAPSSSYASKPNKIIERNIPVFKKAKFENDSITINNNNSNSDRQPHAPPPTAPIPQPLPTHRQQPPSSSTLPSATPSTGRPTPLLSSFQNLAARPAGISSSTGIISSSIPSPPPPPPSYKNTYTNTVIHHNPPPHPPPQLQQQQQQLQFVFPNPPNNNNTKNQPLHRTTIIPDKFHNVAEYSTVMSNALVEELNLKLADLANQFHSIISKHNISNNNASTHQPPPGAHPTYHNSNNNNQKQHMGVESIVSRSALGQSYHPSCTLFIWRARKNNNNNNQYSKYNNKNKGKKQQWKKKGKDDVEQEKDAFYLIVSKKGKSTEYHKDGLWIISNNPTLEKFSSSSSLLSSGGGGRVGDRSRQAWSVIARGLWHGPNHEGKLAIQFLGPEPPGLGKSQEVYALKGPEAGHELSMIDLMKTLPGVMMSNIGNKSLPLLPALLQPSSTKQPRPDVSKTISVPVPSSSSSSSTVLDPERIITRFRLNEEQADVVRHISSWPLSSPSSSNNSNRIALIHGPFGTGKSSLIVALIHYILEARKMTHPSGNQLSEARILVSAHTNVAVDRVLLSLKEAGCGDFLRIGPLRKIDRRLLGQSLHCSESKTTATAASELKEMIKSAANNPKDQAMLRRELVQIEKGEDRRRKKLLKTVPVVGVTCCSALLSALDGHHFDIVILDEASQMLEPLSVIPIMRAGAGYLVAAGDPCQLPPVITSPATISTSSNITAAAAAASGGGGGGTVAIREQSHQQHQDQHPQGLLRPLFVRLQSSGCLVHLLRRQYRCAPAISAIPNRFFYNNQLLNGVTEQQRQSLLPGIPNVVCVSVQGREEYTNGRSIRNTAEVSAVVDIVQKCRQAAAGGERGKKKPSIGVICFFRAQAYAIKDALEKLPPLSTGTVSGTDGGPSHATTNTNTTYTDGDDDDDHGIQVATVDSFQGEEKDIIILSTAITKPGAFATDACRLNVALTRARHNLIVVGHTAALTQASAALGALFKECRSKPGGFWPQGRLLLKKEIVVVVGVGEKKVMHLMNDGDCGSLEIENEQAIEKKENGKEEDLPNFDLI